MSGKEDLRGIRGGKNVIKERSEDKLIQETLWVVYSLSDTMLISTKGKLKGMP